MSACKFCGAEIAWQKKGTQSVPVNPDGGLHRCQTKAASTEEKMKKAGFTEPETRSTEAVAKERDEYNAKGSGGACTSPPAVNPSNSTGLKTVEGQIVALDIPAHKITVKDRAGESHSFVWAQPLHEEFSKLQQWWFTKVTGEHQKDVDIWKATGTAFFKRPDDWPHTGGKCGGRPFHPRNEKLIVAQCLVKAYTDLYIASNPPDGLDFENGRKEILAAVEQDVDRVMKAGGGT
jgi:hypothetical protein